MNIFYYINSNRAESVKFLLKLGCIYFFTFIALTVVLNFVLVGSVYVWEALRVLPIVFGCMSFGVLSLSLTYLTLNNFTKTLCLTAVLCDIRNSATVQAFLLSLCAVNIFTGILIASFISIKFFQPSTDVAHVIYILQAAMIPPIMYCMRILESSIDKIAGLSKVFEKTCIYSPTLRDRTK